MPKHARTDDGNTLGSGQPREEYPDALESLEPTIDDAPIFGSDTEPADVEPISVESIPTGKHGNKKPKPELTAQQRKSRRMRRVLILVVILLFLLIGALVFLGWTLFKEASSGATQYTMQQVEQKDAESIKSEDTKDVSAETTKKTAVPNLSEVIGMTQEAAMGAIGSGATITGAITVNEEGNPIKQSLTIALTDEPSDAKLGTPTVYLGLSAEGLVIMSGYSVATSSLGYGSVSFVDAVTEKGIIESTLAEAGVTVAEGSVALPEDKALYSTYDTDGKTLIQEKYSFSGATDIAGKQCSWSAVLVYDYKLANASGNLADTIRQVYVYIETPESAVVEAPVDAAPAAEGAEGAAA